MKHLESLRSKGIKITELDKKGISLRSTWAFVKTHEQQCGPYFVMKDR
jgi:biotin operon repressor